MLMCKHLCKLLAVVVCQLLNRNMTLIKQITVILIFFISLSQTFVLDCEFDPITWASVPTYYGCKADVIHTGSVSEIDNVIGEHWDDHNNTLVEFIYVYNQTLPRIPLNLKTFFPNIKGIEWHSSKLQKVTAEDLEPFPHLTHFASFYNPLGSLDGDLFKHNPNMLWIYIYNSSLKSIGEDFFSNLNELTFLNFEKNLCINAVAKTPSEIEKLKSQIRLKCSPLNTPKPETVDEFWNHFKTMKENVLELAQLNHELEMKVKELSSEVKTLIKNVKDQKKTIVKYEIRFTKLERKIRESNLINSIKVAVTEALTSLFDLLISFFKKLISFFVNIPENEL
ncbi:CLUMA_CG010164, isoform A [Clunio marinus]|uniref:CLUMA_CG010164, isoform A n=1 Tax=Clunio marinus TaxID=568069 RepID=A0A1J1IDU4_9DIPT|nr:CLUMA_CG010164, isoform A [Clunio marinus]